MSNWLDGTPVLNSAWYNPSNDPRYSQLTIYEIIKGYNKFKPIHHIWSNSTIESQPEMNMTKNCTAVLIGNNIRFFSWVVVPCDTHFEATFICRSVESHDDVNYSERLKPFNFTCEDGWLMYSDMTCFIVIHIHAAMRWTDANSTCSYYNSSILNLDPINWPKSPDYSSNLRHYFRIAFSARMGKEPPRSLIGGNNLMTILFGQALPHKIHRNTLPFNVYVSLLSELNAVRYFVGIENKCSVVVFSALAFHFQKKARFFYQPGWGVKNRACSEYIQTNVLICTKKSKKHLSYCSTQDFKCVDGTCVLGMYVCDGVYDCFDNSDEDLHICSLNRDTSNGIRLNIILPDIYRYSPNSSEPEHINIAIHSVCDGIYTSELANEKYVCRDREAKFINLSAFKENKVMSSHSTKLNILKLIDLYREEILHDQEITVNKEIVSQTLSRNQNITFAHLCENGTACILSEVKCTIGYKHLPVSNLHMDLCMDVKCPGMFKCRSYYCLHLSAVCDGQADCKYGDDERNCSALTCPGLLKCRGEDKCVSPSEICDDRVNCLHSHDDELYCRKCPSGCKCQGYQLACSMNDTSILQNLSFLLYTKSLTLKGIEDKLELVSLKIPAMIYLDVSQSTIGRIVSSDEFYYSMPNVLFANFSSNFLINVRFLSKPIFQNVIVVDLHNNILVVFKNIKLKFLRWLILSRNNMFEISINLDSYMPDLQIIEMRNIRFHFFLQKFIQINTIYNNRAFVFVTDSTLCCIMPHNIRCVSPDSNSQCFGILSATIWRWLYYSLSLVLFLISTMVFMKHLGVKKQGPKSYNILIINQNAADWFCSVCIAVLLFVDIFKVNIILWRRSISCIILNAFAFVSLEASIILKASCILTMALKIMFPFKHQCQWLRYTNVFSCLIWIFMLCLYGLNILVIMKVEGNLFFDAFCSPVGCFNYITIGIMQMFVLSVDLICILAIFAAEYLSFVTLRYKNPTESIIHHNKMFPYRVVCKMGRFTHSEVFFRSYLSVIIISRYFSTENCPILIFIVMPINIIITRIAQCF